MRVRGVTAACKASKSMGVGRPLSWYLERLQPDALRFALASVLPGQDA